MQANTDVISNITYHDVKGHRDDMEKKRSLQGGGENVKEVSTNMEEENCIKNALNTRRHEL